MAKRKIRLLITEEGREREEREKSERELLTLFRCGLGHF